MKKEIKDRIETTLKWKAQRMKVIEDFEAIFQATRTIVIHARMYLTTCLSFTFNSKSGLSYRKWEMDL